jgi:hypothetical protein
MARKGEKWPVEETGRYRFADFSALVHPATAAAA